MLKLRAEDRLISSLGHGVLSLVDFVVIWEHLKMPLANVLPPDTVKVSFILWVTNKDFVIIFLIGPQDILLINLTERSCFTTLMTLSHLTEANSLS